jgi:hypothetical protein
MLPISGSPSKMDTYKSKKYEVSYDEKTINDLKKCTKVTISRKQLISLLK